MILSQRGAPPSGDSPSVVKKGGGDRGKSPGRVEAEEAESLK